MRRTGSIDYIKFIFSLFILFYHFGFLFNSGYIVVEGFFMITGYLMMASLCRKAAETEGSPYGTAKFVFRKYRSVLFPLLFSALIGFVVYEALIYEHPMDFTAERVPLLLFEILPLQMAGFEGMWTTGVSWYLSAMLLGVAILHPLAKKDPLRFGSTWAPVIALLGYGLLSHNYGHLDVPNLWILELVNTGLIRGIAGLCGGFVIYCLANRSGSAEPTLPARFLYSALAGLGWYILFRTVMQPRNERIVSDFILTGAIFLFLSLVLSGKTLLSLVPSSKLSRALATVSTFVYLNHYPWSVYLTYAYPEQTVWQRMPRYFICVAASSLLVWGLTTLCEYLLRLRRRKAV